ncbi:MAG: MarR family transcriptional regulator [Bacteroidales bacterium]|jgi:DNA-binding MarR family transcriptional regulator|nr:MarR family transcriptional regulator [Bacteroidales bacterium]
MNQELQDLVDQFHKILYLYSVIGRKPKDYGTGDLLYFSEIHTIAMIDRNREINITRLADVMGVTKGAISQTISKLVAKKLIIRKNIRNLKEVNLMLSAKGRKVLKAQEAFQNEIFTFAASLYEKAGSTDRELVGRLFRAITANMEERVRGAQA